MAITSFSHDAELDKQSNGKGRVDEHTLEELERLDFGSWFAERYAGERLLTLRDAFDLARAKLNLYLDCKSVDEQQLVREILDSKMSRQVVVVGKMPRLIRVQELSDGRVATMPTWRPGVDTDEWLAALKPAAVGDRRP